MPAAQARDSFALGAARSLAIDVVTVEVVSALREVRVPSILLKGPAVAGLLYGRSPRVYGDADILVPPWGHGPAEGVLHRLGFEERAVAVEPPLGLPHARPWERPADGAQVDLHRSLAGAGAAPDQVWETLAAITEKAPVARSEVDVLSPAGRVLVVTLHAAQHGIEASGPLEDARRAVELMPEETWRSAVALADRIDAGISFAHGLRLVAGGDALALRLGLPPAALVEAARVSASATRLALGFERLASTSGVREKLLFLLREVAPPPAHMRWLSPLARRGRAGLAAAYVARAGSLLWHSPASLIAWWRFSGRGRSGSRSV